MSGASDQPDQGIDEVVVRSKRLVEAIRDAEDEFFRLYNELNKRRGYIERQRSHPASNHR